MNPHSHFTEPCDCLLLCPIFLRVKGVVAAGVVTAEPLLLQPRSDIDIKWPSRGCQRSLSMSHSWALAAGDGCEQGQADEVPNEPRRRLRLRVDESKTVRWSISIFGRHGPRLLVWPGRSLTATPLPPPTAMDSARIWQFFDGIV